MAVTTTTVKTSRVVDHRFYYAVAAGLILVVFAGFARTYYLKGMFGAPPLPMLVHIHGAVMTLWYALFAVQVRLVATHRVGLHRKLGWAGIFLAGLVAVLGTMVSLGLCRRRLVANPNSQAAPFLFGMQLFPIVLVLIILVAAAVYWRRRTDYHKRLMTLAMLTTLGPAIVRLPIGFIEKGYIAATIAVDIALILVCIIVDAVRNRRLHPAFGWGGLLTIGSIFVFVPVCQSETWARMVRWMLSS